MSFVSELERELVQAGHARQRRRRLRRFDFGGAVVAAAGVSALVVVLAVVVLVGQPRRPAPSAGQRSSIPPAAALLAAKLLVLRRPQTAADRSLPDAIARTAARGAYIPGLTRLATTAPGARAFLVVSAPDPANVALTRQWPLVLGDRVSLVIMAKDETDTSQPAPLAGLGAANTLRNGAYVATIVPDGVAWVRFTLMVPGQPSHHQARSGGAAVRVPVRSVAVDAPVAGNVALAASRGGSRALGVQWYAADGHKLWTPQPLLTGLPRVGWKPSYAQPAPPALATRLRSTFPTFAAGPWSHSGLDVSRPSLPEMPAWLTSSAIPSPGPPGFVPPSIYLRSTLRVLTSTGVEAWVVPSSEGLCVYGSQGGGCGGGKSLVSGAWGVITALDGTPYEVGVLPKTNPSVTVLKNSGARWRIPVHDGVVVFDAIGVMEVDYQDAGGRPTHWF